MCRNVDEIIALNCFTESEAIIHESSHDLIEAESISFSVNHNIGLHVVVGLFAQLCSVLQCPQC